MSKYIEITKHASSISKNRKTGIYAVDNKKTGDMLGVIRWHGAWRQYCFFPMGETIFNTDCMQYLIDFIKDLMEKRKNEIQET